jgi:phosphatidylinositol kinase/protein kinase (PI-3  family)
MYPDSFKLSLRNSDKFTAALREMMWRIVIDADIWLGYQTKFPKSLAVMSMVGSVIRLGYGHFNNILFGQRTSSVIHIDFGGCFDSSRTRERHREYVSLTLTRILRIALGRTEREGRLKRVCQQTMTNIRRPRCFLDNLTRDTQSPRRISQKLQNFAGVHSKNFLA